MFYDAVRNEHGLKHDPFKALVAPRPIGWISTIGTNGVRNLAPYSFFAAVAEKPAYVLFSASGAKDSRRNAEETGEFTCSIATKELARQMKTTSSVVPPDTDEFVLAGLEAVPSSFVRPPRVKGSPAALECKYWRTVELPHHDGEGKVHAVVFGLVVGIYIDDQFIKDGIVDTLAMQPLARLGYRDYISLGTEGTFTL
jgi:flavin reductase (DIM6/NTAB) family NADH-FMN oxidoreductase RutF